ncbi:MAG: glutamate 5-kinase [Clostridia bacterium]|nr:glutamate 5-kinase [Clostridia bacterium]
MANIQNAKRIVIKVGTSTLTYENGKPNIRSIDHLCRVISDLCNSGREIVLVTSGALGVGVGKMGLAQRPTDTAGRQAMAAVGQCELMFLYDKIFAEYGMKTAQVLLTRYDVENEHHRQNVIDCMSALLNLSIIPIVNENDTVAIDELTGSNIGDNDNLSAIVAQLIGAQSLVLITDIDGLYNRNPREDDSAVQIPVVLEITDALKEMAGGSGSTRGTGGMVTKIQAAEYACAVGIDTYIVSSDPNNLYALTDGKVVGTHFVPQ